MGVEVAGVGLVHLFEEGGVSQIDGCFDDFFQAASRLFEDGFDIVQDSPSLFSYSSLDWFACFRVQGDHSRGEEEAVFEYSLGVGSYGLRSLPGLDCFQA